MPAAYDKYDYQSYWDNRKYEHESEVAVVKDLLSKIPNIEKILDIGGGYGRLTPTYLYRAKKIILSDPSAKLLKSARQRLPNKKIQFLQSRIENIPDKVRAGSIDLVIMVRVLHHIVDLDMAFGVINKVLKPNGYFILEFANKGHGKSTIHEFLKGNFTFPLDIFSVDVRSEKSKKKNMIPFFNFHPDFIANKLKNYDLEINEKRSVSNIRSPFIKKYIPTSTLVSIEKLLQKPLSYLNFGPSIFILAKKT